MAKDKPHEPDKQVLALFENAHLIAVLRRDEPTTRAAEMEEWLLSEGWSRLVRFARGAEWDIVLATLEALDVEAARTAMAWCVLELSRLEP
jgi:hypothetical protein